MNKYFVLIICVLFIAVGQVLFKFSAGHLKLNQSIWLLLWEPVFIAAVALYGLTTFVWVWCLQDIPLSRAYLFMSLAYVFVPILSWLFFSETFTWKYFLGMFLIISGIICSIS